MNCNDNLSWMSQLWRYSWEFDRENDKVYPVRHLLPEDEEWRETEEKLNLLPFRCRGTRITRKH